MYRERMTGLLFGAVFFAMVAAVLLVLVLPAHRVRRRGSAGPAIAAAMAAYDEAMHSTAHDTFVEMQIAEERTVPAPAPGDLVG